jgi:hypothetical protein
MPSTHPSQPKLILLGPQRLRPTLAEARATLGIEGPVAAITAGWQDREAEDEELREHLGPDTVNLELYRRAEKLFADDRRLFQGHRQRQDSLREAQRIYRRRLRHAMAAAREVLEMNGGSNLLDEARREAIAAIQQLDSKHLDSVRRIHRRFRRDVRPDRRAGLRRQRAEISRLLAGCDALAIAGGHVTVLLNRLRLFDLLYLASQRPIIAWSAGAMALAERVVVFHDSPPQGAGDAEVLETGFGRLRGLLPLPHARRRLRLGDPLRVGLLARRFAPSICVALDEGDRLTQSEAGWVAEAPARRLTEAGELVTINGPLEMAD